MVSITLGKQTCRSTRVSWNRTLLAQVRWPVIQLSQLLAKVLNNNAQKLKDEWTVADVKDLTKLVVKVNACKPILMFRPSEPGEAGSADRMGRFFCKRAKGAMSRRIHHNEHFLRNRQ